MDWQYRTRSKPPSTVMAWAGVFVASTDAPARAALSAADPIILRNITLITSRIELADWLRRARFNLSLPSFHGSQYERSNFN